MNRYEIWVMPLIAEFIGQCWFAFMHSMTANTISVDANATQYGDPILPAMTDGIYVTITVISIGHISGAHVNTAVSTAILLSGGIKPVMYCLYVIVQLCGSLAGAGLALAVNGRASGSFALGNNVTAGQGVLCETLLTFLLAYAVLMTAVDQGSALAAFAIGFSIMIDIYAGFTITGACMNPSLSFGPAVVAGQWEDYWVYWVGPLTGAILAAIVHRLLLGNRQKRLIFKGECSEPDNQLESTETDGTKI